MSQVARWTKLGSLSLINFAEKHAERLERSACAPIAAIAPPVRTAVSETRLAHAAARPLLALRRAATARKDEADDGLDAFIASMSYDLLAPALLDGDRDAAAYRVLFPQGNLRFISGPDRAQLVQVQMMVSVLRADPSHPLAQRADALEVLAKTLDAALKAQSAAEGAYEAARIVESDKREALERVLRKSRHLLMAELMDPALVDAYFPTLAEATVAEDDAAEASPSAAAPTTPA